MAGRLLVAVCAALALGAGTGAPSAAGLAATGGSTPANRSPTDRSAPDEADPETAAPDEADPGAVPNGATAPPAGAGRPVSDLHVGRADPEAAHPGGSTTVHAFVTNGGPDRTASGFTVLVALPVGTRAEGPFFPESCQVSEDGRRVRCVFPSGLSSLRSATAVVPVRVGPDAPAPGALTGGRVVVVGPDDPDPSDNRQPFEITVLPE